MNIDNIIKFENQSSYVEFKKQQSPPSNKDEFLKDIMAMANANIENSIRYIIIGVKHLPNGERDFHPIPAIEFIDDASKQKQIGYEYLNRTIQ